MLGMVLEAEHLLNRVQVLAVAAAQQERKRARRDVPFGEMAVQLGFMTERSSPKRWRSSPTSPSLWTRPSAWASTCSKPAWSRPPSCAEALAVSRATGMPLGQVLVPDRGHRPALLDTMLHVQRMERITHVCPRDWPFRLRLVKRLEYGRRANYRACGMPRGAGRTPPSRSTPIEARSGEPLQERSPSSALNPPGTGVPVAENSSPVNASKSKLK